MSQAPAIPAILGRRHWVDQIVVMVRFLLLPPLGLCCTVGWTTLAQEVEAEEVMLLLHGTWGAGSRGTRGAAPMTDVCAQQGA